MDLNKVTVQGSEVTINDTVLKMPYGVLDAFVVRKILVVLLDPDIYLADAAYKAERRLNGAALRNLRGFDLNGNRLWEDEFPQASDYYYKVSSRDPLEAYSFSSFACKIDPASGRILSKEFFK